MPNETIAGFPGGGAIHFTWVPDPDEIAWQIMQLALELEDRSQPLALSREVAIKDVREHFEKQESPDGLHWAPWAESYAPVAERVNLGKILQQTYDLQNAATARTAYPVTDDSLFFDLSGLPPYGLFHETGTGGTVHFRPGDTLPSGHEVDIDFVDKGDGRGSSLPPRPFAGISQDAMFEIAEIFEQWFAGAVNDTFVTKGGATVGVKRGAGGRFAKQG